MLVETPRSPLTPDHDTEAGVIEDARARQRRHRRTGAVLTAAAVAAGALVLGMSGGGGAGGAGGNAHGQPSSSGAAAGPGHADAGKVFPGAPSSQPNLDVVATHACPLAASNRYLPAWSGCVTARVADLSGNGRPDLILTYSRLSHRHVSWPGAPSSLRPMFEAKQAMLRVVTPTRVTITTPIQGAMAAVPFSIAHVSDEPGKELSLTRASISSATAVAYSLYHGRLIPAGVNLDPHAGFECLGNPPRIIQRQFELIQGQKLVGRAIYGWWQETNTTYAWHGPRLAKTAQRSFEHHGLPMLSVGVGCTKGIG